MVVQECHLWLNLAEMKDANKARFLDAPISQAGLFGDTVEGFAQQFSAVQQQTEAIQHILSRRDAPSTAAPGARPQSARRRGRPPASSRAAPPQAESTHRPARRASRRRAAPPLTRATRRCWSLLFLRRRREQGRSFPRWSQVKSSHLYLYSAFNNTNCNKALHNIKIGKFVNNVK